MSCRQDNSSSSISRCSCSDPLRVLVLDEPEQRLDPHKRAILTDILSARTESGQTLVIATHDEGLSDALADYVLELAAW
jgi:ABC-2 type transport system ATP-binding protein